MATLKEIKNISIIGAGNVATHLAVALHDAGIHINCVCSRHIENATILAERVGAEAYPLMKDYTGWSKDDLVIVAVKDDAILKVIETDLLLYSNVVHTSGSFDSVDMKPHCGSYGAFYPFQTFRKENEMEISEVPFFVESSDELVQKLLVVLGNKLSDNVQVLSSEGRRKLHISGVFINNFIYYILDKMKGYCLEHKIDSASLMPLVHKTIDNALLKKENLQTGPAVRGDKETILQHIDMLQGNKAMQELYMTLSSLIYEETNGEKIELQDQPKKG
ncbi:MAG: putative short-subunit dehydrogenase-like oxidoreductase (DUF2520 family) [Flavobacteriales bacterium]